MIIIKIIIMMIMIIMMIIIIIMIIIITIIIIIITIISHASTVHYQCLFTAVAMSLQYASHTPLQRGSHVFFRSVAMPLRCVMNASTLR